MKLAPHDAELVEADARQLWEQMKTHHPRRPAWDDLSDTERELCRRIAADPYRMPPPPYEVPPNA